MVLAQEKSKDIFVKIRCVKNTFILDYTNIEGLQETKQQIIKMAINGSGIRDKVRVLGGGIKTVLG